MQKSAVATQPSARSSRQLPAELGMNKGQKFEPFCAFGSDRRSVAWLQKVDRKR